jgi:DsbC/DsbD-like thiol-disulfide interchange protein
MPLRPLATAFLATLGHLVASAAALASGIAGDATPFTGEPEAQVRLLAGAREERPQGPVLWAGLEVKLVPGFKTYWRYPGDTGVPPRFDWSASRNVEAVKVHWPVPGRFETAGFTSLGWGGGVVLPLEIIAVRPDRPVDLALTLDYAACETICLPLQATLALRLAPQGRSGAADRLIREWFARVPVPLAPGAPAPEGTAAVVAATRAGEAGVLVEVAVPPGARAVDLLVEGPDERFSLPLPRADGATEGPRRRFRFALEGLPPGVSAASPLALRLTAIADGRASETTLTLP